MKIRVRKQDLVVGLLLCCLMQPNSIKYTQFAAIGSLIAIIVSCLIIVKYGCDSRNMNTFAWIALLSFVQTISTLYNHGSIITCVKNLGILIALSIFIPSRMNKNSKGLLKTVTFIVAGYIILESITTLWGIDFLYSYNQVYILYPLLVYPLIIDWKNNKDKKSRNLYAAFTVLVIAIPILFSKSRGLGDVEWTFYLELLIVAAFCLFDKKMKNISSYILVGVIFAINITVVVTGSLLRIPYIANIITNIFHKSLTLTGRTELWEASIALIIKKPILGYGMSWEGLRIWDGFYVPHNQFLYFTVIAGIPFLCIVLIWLMQVLKKAESLDRKIIGAIGKYCIISGLASFTTLSYGYDQMIPFFILVMLVSNSGFIIDEK